MAATTTLRFSLWWPEAREGGRFTARDDETLQGGWNQIVETRFARADVASQGVEHTNKVSRGGATAPEGRWKGIKRSWLSSKGGAEERIRCMYPRRDGIFRLIRRRRLDASSHCGVERATPGRDGHRPDVISNAVMMPAWRGGLGEWYHFPDDDPRWRCQFDQLLAHTVEILRRWASRRSMLTPRCTWKPRTGTFENAEARTSTKRCAFRATREHQTKNGETLDAVGRGEAIDCFAVAMVRYDDKCWQEQIKHSTASCLTGGGQATGARRAPRLRSIPPETQPPSTDHVTCHPRETLKLQSSVRAGVVLECRCRNSAKKTRRGPVRDQQPAFSASRGIVAR